MGKLITQSILLPAPAETLFAMYIDAEKHAAITGGAAKVHPEPGGVFSAFDGALTGTFYHIVKPRLILQAWRSVSFRADEPDTTLILSFTPEGEKGRIDMVHLNVPTLDYKGVKNGWNTFYWNPWKKYLKEQK